MAKGFKAAVYAAEGKKELRMKVRRTNGTLPNKSNAGTWLSYWEKLSGQSAYLCFGQGCISTPSVGALIQKDSLGDKNLYVIPLCDDCNKKSGKELDIWDTKMLVSVDATAASGTIVTPRSFAPWASEQFLESRVFSQGTLPNR